MNGQPLTPANDDAGTFQGAEAPGTKKEPNWWEEDGAPAGSTAESLYYIGDDGKKHVAPPTHYHHLADGRVIGGYAQGTHYTETGPDGKDRVLTIIGNHPG